MGSGLLLTRIKKLVHDAYLALSSGNVKNMLCYEEVEELRMLCRRRKEGKNIFARKK
jgi:hypothetical protein